MHFTKISVTNALFIRIILWEATSWGIKLMYMHYGVKVKIVRSESSFRDHLVSRNISFQELPIVNTGYLVITYKKPELLFALIRKQIHFGKLTEIIYITDSIPLDCCWENLIIDMIQQEKGHPPMKLKSRHQAIMEVVEPVVMEILYSRYYPDQLPPLNAAIPQEEKEQLLQKYLSFYD